MKKESYFQRMEDYEREVGIEFTSYGIAPNPNGYSYTVTDRVRYDRFVNTFGADDLDQLCDDAPRGYLS